MSDVELDSGGEDSPLLSREMGDLPDSPIEEAGTTTTSDAGCAQPYASRRKGLRRLQIHSPKQIVLLISVVKFFIVMSGTLLLIPLYRIIEDMLCHVHFQDDSDDIIDEMKCKVDEVQARLAYMTGWFGLLGAVVTLLVAFPYGMLADRIGRKPTILFSYLGVCISFYFAPMMLRLFSHAIRRNPYVLMCGYVLQVFGGGVPVLLATLYAVATDVSAEQDKAASFLYLTFGATAGGLIGPITAGLLMKTFGPWVPIYCVMAVTPLVFALMFFIPETLQIDTKKRADEGEESGAEAFTKHMAKGIHDLRQSVTVLKNKNVPLILITFVFQSVRVAAYTATLTQYVSKHFKWRLGDVTLLLAPFGFLNLILLTILPKISDILLSPRFKFTVFQKDLLLTRLSILFIVIGAVIDGFSSSVILFLFGIFISTLGAADSPLARATLSHHVDAQFTSRLQALIGMSEVLGSFIGGPVLALLFDIGLRKKGIWKGLPWFYIAMLLTISGVALGYVSEPEKMKSSSDADSADNLQEYPREQEEQFGA